MSCPRNIKELHMKKLLPLILIIALAACVKTELPPPDTSEISDTSESATATSATTTVTTTAAITTAATTTTAAPKPLTEAELYLSQHYEDVVIDGSTSTIPLHVAIRNYFGYGSDTEHSLTVESLNKLINGEADILLSVDYSDELLKKAADAGVKLVRKEITREALVFLVHRDNPVKSLTSAQIKDIYSGKITNWKQVGGDDEPINAFQRNEDSGSQMSMRKFMGSVKLTDQDVTYYQMMGAIIEAIADYDRGKYSVAYNMYTFTEKQYSNGQIALLDVDGVHPTDDTIYDNSYPIVIYNYLYYDANNEKAAEFAENLYEFLLSDDGQKLISEAGYVALNKKFDRNMYVYYDYWWDENVRFEKNLDFYNEQKGEFYDLDENDNLLTFYNYPDYALRDSKYKTNEKAREFAQMWFDSGVDKWRRYEFYTHDDQGEVGVIVWRDYTFDEMSDLFTFRYKGEYYDSFYYLINEDKYKLANGYDEEFINGVKQYGGAEAFAECYEHYEIGASVVIDKDELKNVYVVKDPYRPKVTVNGVEVEEYNVDTDDIRVVFEYAAPFK